MAVTFAEEVLRIMQNTIPLHEALPSPYAEYSPAPDLPPSGCCTYMEECCYLVEIPACIACLDDMASMVHADNLEGPLLDGRR